MQNKDLSRDYIKRAKVRLEAVELLLMRHSFADVVREAQEVVELALKSLLRKFGIQPPRIHDVSQVLLDEKSSFPKAVQENLSALAKISKTMRRDRELAFYGTEDLTPSDFYTEEDAQLALQNAQFVVEHVWPHVISG